MPNDQDRITTPYLKDNSERSVDLALRPKNFSEFVGQDKLKEKLSVFVQAAKKRQEPLDHCLFHGPPGLGKTTLAHIMSNEMGVEVKETSGPAIEKPGDLAALLTNLPDKSVFFIDEIHRLSRHIEEALYPAMQNYQLDIIVGEGPSARSIKLELPRFTLVGATTRAGFITSAMRGRFGIQERLNFYGDEDIEKIIIRSAQILGITIDEPGAGEIAKRSRGTPRIANRLLRRVRDYAQVREKGVIDLGVSKKALEMFEVDEKGLDDMDRKILDTIVSKFSGGPVGLSSIAVAIGEEEDTISDIYEPFLIQCGFIARTPSGRKATKSAYEHLNRKIRHKDKGLFDDDVQV
ncbi:MAG: Holliday junction branch migration DNA helicase RuvB [Elusimicrobia bacterium]|nr:Holliday junction branch migration DNA helicase RuvB [Elusimicrobiota bacterium]